MDMSVEGKNYKKSTESINDLMAALKEFETAFEEFQKGAPKR
jgi:hypothetical protein